MNGFSLGIIIFGLTVYAISGCCLYQNRHRITNRNNRTPPPISIDILVEKLNKCVVSINPLVDPEECCICLQIFSDSNSEVVRLPCSHLYHKKCIQRWFLKNSACPLCKSLF